MVGIHDLSAAVFSHSNGGFQRVGKTPGSVRCVLRLSLTIQTLREAELRNEPALDRAAIDSPAGLG